MAEYLKASATQQYHNVYGHHNLNYHHGYLQQELLGAQLAQNFHHGFPTALFMQPKHTALMAHSLGHSLYTGCPQGKFISSLYI